MNMSDYLDFNFGDVLQVSLPRGASSRFPPQSDVDKGPSNRSIPPFLTLAGPIITVQPIQRVRFPFSLSTPLSPRPWTIQRQPRPQRHRIDLDLDLVASRLSLVPTRSHLLAHFP